MRASVELVQNMLKYEDIDLKNVLPRSIFPMHLIYTLGN
jgi:hypothetical protein